MKMFTKDIRKLLAAFMFSVGLFGSFCIEARDLSPTEALQRLRGSYRAARACGLKEAERPRLIHAEMMEDGMPAIYVFNRPKKAGFLVIPADDCAVPLLGYTDGGEFDYGNLPPAFEDWIKGYAAQIEWGRKHPAGMPVIDNRATKAPSRGGWQPVEPLCSTSWDQGAPYNLECPIGRDADRTRCYTGCMATAMAQVMKAYSWPIHPSGSVSYEWKDASGRDTITTQMSMTFDGMAFDWANMRRAYPQNGYMDEEGTAVATLMKACGYGAQMNYGIKESGASLTNAVSALISNFDYSPDTQILYRDYFGLGEWEELVYGNLREGAPMIYTGYTPDEAGHAFVLDGYSEDGFYHANWGWSGFYNGYFKIFGLSPAGYGIGGAAGGFNTNQMAAFNLQPSVMSTLEKTLFYLVLDGQPTATIEPDGSLTMGVTNGEYGENGGGFLYLNRGEKESFRLGIGVENLASGDTSYEFMETSVELAHNVGVVKSPGWDISSLPDGDYMVYPVFRVGDSEEIQRVRSKVGVIDYARFNVANGLVTVQSVTPKQPFIKGLPMSNAKIYSAQVCKIHVAVENPADNTEWHNSLGIYLFSADSTATTSIGYFANFATEDHTRIVRQDVVFDIEPGKTAEDDFQGFFVTTNGANSANFAPAGEYRIVFVNTTTMVPISKFYTFTIHPNPGNGILACNNFSVIGNPDAVDPENLRFDISTKCLSGYYGGPLVVEVYDMADELVGRAITCVLNLCDGVSGTVTLDFPIAPTPYREEYVAKLYYYDEAPTTSNLTLLGQPIVFHTSSHVTGLDSPEDGLCHEDALFPLYDMNGRDIRNGATGGRIPNGVYVRKGHKVLIK